MKPFILNHKKQLSFLTLILFAFILLFSLFSPKNLSFLLKNSTFSQKTFSVKAQSPYPQCQQGRITSPCQCGNQIYNAGFCCYHPNANSGIWFDPSYEDILPNSCPTGNFYFVDQNNPNASDENPGTEDLPWKTLKKACNTVQAGDTVLVKTGRYSDPDPTKHWQYALNPVNSGEPGKPIIFRSYPRHAATLVKSHEYNAAMRVNQRSYIIIDGFKAEGSIGFHKCSHCVVRNCEVIVGTPEGGATLNWGIFLYKSDHCLVENNYVHDMHDYAPGSHNAGCFMIFQGSDNIFQHNLANALCDDGESRIVNAYGQKAGDIYRNIWRYNIALNAKFGFLGMASTDATLPSEDNIYYQNIAINCKAAFYLNHMCYRYKIYNNVAYDCEEFLHVRRTSDSLEMWNNIAIGDNICLKLEEVYPEILLNYSNNNDFYGYSTFCQYHWSTFASTLNEWQGKTSFDDNSISTDPLFVNPESHDFHLSPSSPCLNAGIDRQDYDNDGNTTESINMGAYITGNETIGLIDLSQYIVEESQPNSCASQNGVCCNENQICQNGTFISSSDCGNLCCTGECVSPSVPGDLNQDNKVNSSDFQILIQKFKEIQNIETEDLNSDGIVDIKDIGILMHYWTN